MFDDKLKELRKKRGIYQKDLADELSVSKSTVAMWETGSRMPDVETIKRIASFFNVSVDYLIDQEQSNPNTNAISDVYLSFAKNAQDEGIDPDDIRLAIETIKNMKKRDQ